MELDQVQLEMLEMTAQDAGMEFREDYSGRGMYGKTCIGIVGGVSGLIDFIIRVAQAGDDEVICELGGVATDSMGIDKIFYWSGLERGDQ